MDTIEQRTGWVIRQAECCTECGLCLDSCPTYKATQEILFSPMQRLKTAAAVCDNQEIRPEQLESMYNCPKCMRCEAACPEKIDIVRVVHTAREKIAERGLGPSDRHNAVIDNILATGNAVNGDPGKRLDWLPEPFPDHESDTLLFLGCLPSYLVKEAARSSYLVLKKLGYDFMILQDEGCCGTYLYESGRTDLAKELFQKNAERFASLGIKKIVVPCNGCLKCFKYFYPELLGETGFSVQHVVEAIRPLLAENRDALKKLGKTVTYQDPCRLARGEKMCSEPREILTMCGLDLEEMDHSGEDALCCGAGGGIRSVYRKLSLELAGKLLEEVKTDTLVSTCPFCTFNLNFASSRKKMDREVVYFTSFVLEALS